jgi:hypothetical protein
MLCKTCESLLAVLSSSADGNQYDSILDLLWAANHGCWICDHIFNGCLRFYCGNYRLPQALSSDEKILAMLRAVIPRAFLRSRESLPSSKALVWYHAILDTDADGVDCRTICFVIDKKRFSADVYGRRKNMQPDDELLFYFRLVPLPGRIQHLLLADSLIR